MYYYLNGTLAYCDPQTVVVDCGGVGYQCNVSATTYQAVQGQKDVRLYTYLHVKEDAMTLFGFSEEREKELFLLLISISGVGPKVALSILSELTAEHLAAAVVSGDHGRISRANGVGPKLAQRICLELKDKIGKTDVRVSEAQMAQAAAGREALRDAQEILLSFGYSKNDVGKALERCTADNSQDLVRQALRLLSNV